MKTSKAQIEASKRYLKKNDRISVVFPSGTRDRINNIICYIGYYDSVPEFIKEAVEEKIQKCMCDVNGLKK